MVVKNEPKLIDVSSFMDDRFTQQDDRGDICKNMDQYGHGRGTMHGGFCEFSLVKAKYCYVIKTDITADEAALLEPMGEFSIKGKPWITPDKEKKFSGWMI